MVRHVFLIATQKLPDTGQLETQIAVRPMGLCWAAAIDGSRLELPSRLTRIYTSNEGREEGGIVIVYPRQIAAKGSLCRIRVLPSHADLMLDLFVRFVLRNEVLKLEREVSLTEAPH